MTKSLANRLPLTRKLHMFPDKSINDRFTDFNEIFDDPENTDVKTDNEIKQ